MCDVTSGYNYGGAFEAQLLAAGLSQVDVDKIKIWNRYVYLCDNSSLAGDLRSHACFSEFKLRSIVCSGYPKEPEKGFCTISNHRNVIQNDDSDQVPFFIKLINIKFFCYK